MICDMSWYLNTMSIKQGTLWYTSCQLCVWRVWRVYAIGYTKSHSICGVIMQLLSGKCFKINFDCLINLPLKFSEGSLEPGRFYLFQFIFFSFLWYYLLSFPFYFSSIRMDYFNLTLLPPEPRLWDHLFRGIKQMMVTMLAMQDSICFNHCSLKILVKIFLILHNIIVLPWYIVLCLNLAWCKV